MRDRIVEAARAWKGTPFVHQGRTKGPSGGVDCVGVVIEVARELGLSDFQTTDYTAQPDAAEMQRLLEMHLDYVPAPAKLNVRAGDVLWFRAPEPQHLAIVTEAAVSPDGLAWPRMSMVHAFSRIRGQDRALRRVGLVVEGAVDQVWRARLHAAFRFRGVE